MDKKIFYSKLNIPLSEQQKTAVETVNGPVLLLAVPGSGKTTVLVARIGYMILCKGIAPTDILVLTYTVAAASDMKNRFVSIFKSVVSESPEFRTINGICAKIIAYYGYQTGRNPFDLLQDDKKTAAMVSGIYQNICNEYPTETEIKGVRTAMTYIKNMMLSDDEIFEMEKSLDFPISRIYKAYNEQLRSSRLMDYDDQMVYAYRILQANKDTLHHFQKAYKYICVDEAQDTSKIQHKIIALLASDNDNLFMVGDEDQSIYGFRAAYPDALLEFEKEHDGAKVLLMETNYRSNARIVSAADRFIKKNTLRHDKNMIPAREESSEIRILDVKTAYGQYQYLKKVASNCTQETAVLYRDNESAIPLVDLLEREGIDFRVRNADFSFFTHRIVTDIRYIIRFAYNPYDAEAFMQVYYKLNLYLNKKNAQAACELSRNRDIPLLDAARQLQDISGYMRSSIKAVQTNLYKLRSEETGKALFRICEPCGYNDFLERNGISGRKLATLKALASKARTPLEFLERLSFLETYLREKENDRNCRFILSTIHSSKGLEYDTVYLMDVEDGILPESIPTESNPKGKELSLYEEERRLFYVGITRAKNNLNIFRMENTSSLFIDQLLGKEIKKAQDNGLVHRSSVIPTVNVKEFLAQIDSGVIVYHASFGEGVVVSADESLIKVQFANRRVALSTPMVVEKNLLTFEG